MRLPIWFALCLTFCACGAPGQDEDSSVPYPRPGHSGEIRGEGNFATLMKKLSQGVVKPTPWAGYWWPYAEDGTSASLSLYEQASGRSGAVSWELSHHGTRARGIKQWFGHCNGWSAAAALFPEPRSQVNADGVPFGIADQKALLSEAAMEVKADYFGNRDDDDNPSSLSFQDVFPDQFFLVLTNFVGHGMPIIVDRYTGSQVWNQPLAGYQISPVRPSDDLGTDPSAPNVHRVMVTAQLWWLRDDVSGDHLTEPFSFADSASYQSRVLRFEIWLDAPPRFDGTGSLVGSGNIVLARQGNYAMGGAWRNTDLNLLDSYPDYIWIPHAVAPSTGFSNPGVDASYLIRHFGQRG